MKNRVDAVLAADEFEAITPKIREARVRTFSRASAMSNRAAISRAAEIQRLCFRAVWMMHPSGRDSVFHGIAAGLKVNIISAI